MTDLLEDTDRLRKLLLEGGLAKGPQIDDLLRRRDTLRRADGSRPRLGEILIQEGVISSEDSLLSLASMPRAFASALPPDVAAKAANPEACFGKYVLLQEVGRGASGVVFRAWDRYLSQTVALKVLMSQQTRPGDSVLPAEDVEGFLREARTAVRLRHPNIVRVFEVGCIDGRYYISMDFVGGPTLHERIHELRRAQAVPWRGDPDRMLDILIDVAMAIHYAHSQSPALVHRDLKPGNILIGETGQAFVADFGLAREVLLEAHDAGRGAVKGTPSYMAPEQAEGRMDQIDARTDVYGLGAILYEALCGRPPFESSNVAALLYQVATRNPEPPSRRAGSPAGFPADLEGICLRAMARDKGKRFASAREFADALSRIRDARRPSARGTVRRPSRRFMAVALGLVLTAGIVGLVRRTPPPQVTAASADLAPAAAPDTRRRDWESALEALRTAPWGGAIEELRRHYEAAPSHRREFADSWKWVQPALSTLIADRARALAGRGPSAEWLAPEAKGESRQILERMDALEALGRDLDAPFDESLRWDEWRPALERVERWQGVGRLRVNVVPYAELLVVQGGRERMCGWTPALVQDLEVAAGPVQVVLLWPSREDPKVRLVQDLGELRDGEGIDVSGRMNEGRLHVKRR